MDALATLEWVRRHGEEYDEATDAMMEAVIAYLQGQIPESAAGPYRLPITRRPEPWWKGATP